MLEIETERLRMRAVTLQDTGIMLAVWNDPAFIRNVADRGIRTDDEAREAIENGALQLFRDFGYGPCCISLKSDGAMIGICGLFKRENLDEPDIGFAILPGFCGKGYAYEAAAATVKYAREQLNLRVITAIVSPNNAASIGLIEKLGLRFERVILMPGECDAIRLYSMSLSD